MKKIIFDFLTSHGFNQFAAEATWALGFIAILGIGAAILHAISNKVILYYLHKVFKKTKTDWDDKLMDNKTFHPLAHIIPLSLLIIFLPEALEDFPAISPIVVNFAQAAMVFIFSQVATRLVKSVHDIVKDFKAMKGKAIKSYFELANIFIYVVTAIFIFSILVGQEVGSIVAGLGAMTAVLMFVFKDALLGLIASVQLSANDMVKVGDWVTMDSKGVDGDIEEMKLTTIKVRNFDKTIVTVPAYAFIENPFKNWRGMQETGGRRICRNINFSVKSIKHADSKLLNKLKEIDVLKHYIEDKQKEHESHNKTSEGSSLLNKRNFTNIGLFRKYIENYLKSHKNVHGDLTCMVRQMPQTSSGVPLQLYCFTTTTVWAEYEAIQSDIFDHLLAAAPMFDLDIFEFGTEMGYVGEKTKATA